MFCEKTMHFVSIYIIMYVMQTFIGIMISIKKIKSYDQFMVVMCSIEIAICLSAIRMLILQSFIVIWK